MARIRFHVQTRDVPPAVAARALGLTLEAFQTKLTALLARGFPAPDPTTGNFDSKAIERWQDTRYPQLLGGEKAATAVDARLVMRDRLKA